MSDERGLLDALADDPPAPAGLRREHEIRRAVDAGLAAPAPATGSTRRWWAWATFGATAAAAAAAIAIWVGARPSSGAALVVERGAIAAPEMGQLVEVPAHDRVVLRTPDDSTVEAGELTRFARDDRAATRWHLERGHLASHVTKRAPGQTFEVATPEATVAVIGTRFSVDRAVLDGVATTQVVVDEGVVQVTPVHGAPVILHAGERWPAATQITANDRAKDGANVAANGSAAGASDVDNGSNDGANRDVADGANGGRANNGTNGDRANDGANGGRANDGANNGANGGSANNGANGANDGANTTETSKDRVRNTRGNANSNGRAKTLATPGTKDVARDRANTTAGDRATTADPVQPPARPFDATAIRKTIRAGNLTDARHLIDAGKTAAHAAPDLAELGILAAEAELAGRATRRAIDLYLAVVRDYPATPQAEQALFAAAQLAFDRPDAGYRPQAMLRDYLDTYPHGQFAGDARRLLDRARN